MKTSVLTIIAVVVSASAANAQVHSAHRLSNPRTVFRAQSPPVVPNGTVIPQTPQFPLTEGYPAPAPSGDLSSGVGDGTWNAFAPPQEGAIMGGTQVMPEGAIVSPGPSGGQPYSVYQPPMQPYPSRPGYPGFNPMSPGYPTAPFSQYGANPPTPHRFGWQTRLDISWLSSEPVSAAAGGATGNFGVFGLDLEGRYTQMMPGGWIFTNTPQFGYRNWDGPGVVGLPDSVYRFGWDFRMETPRGAAPYSLALSFNPSINTDFGNNLSSNAWNLDGSGVMMFQLDQFWQLMVGAGYWDRVRDRVIPYAGLIYTDDFWEWRLTFPEARVSLFLGNEYMWSKWLYVRGEYHVESYEIDATFGGATGVEQIEIEDWRALVGFRMDTGVYDWFVEGGWVFGRDVNFGGATPDFSVGTGFIGQIGVRF